jgi:histidinol-phosphatase (PHP family)
MFKADYHAHSSQSFDAGAEASIEAMIEAAAAQNLDEIILCDHYDVNWVISGENPDIDFNVSQNQINATVGAIINRPCVSGGGRQVAAPTRALLGIELGQPNQFPEKANEVLAKYDFDFVLCALHNARDEPDFYFVDYKNTDITELLRMFEKYTNELCELANWGDFHALAHITYPLRYFFLNDIHVPLRYYSDLYIKLFKILIHRGVALEVNTSGLRNGMRQPSPPYDLIKLYKETGGELITAGSDAHSPADVFSGIEHIYKYLHETGFKYITAVENKKLIQKKIKL